jgi:class 3 adenylate cyclase/tetratricopeptide (TPR) repeat protein
MQCLRCQRDNPSDANYCLECGARLGLSCAKCGRELPAAAKFCPECGDSVSRPTIQSRVGSPDAYTPRHLVEKILTSRSALEGERKQVTVLFCDLANSTGLAEQLGPEPMHRLLNGFFELALAEVHRYEGTINQFLGDGFMALFGAPLALEDHARRGVLAALGIQRRLRERRGDFGVPDGVELAVRMGLNTGPVVVGKIGDNLRMDYTAVGDTTNLAARLQQLAQVGAILLGEATADLVKRDLIAEPLGRHLLKGRTEPVSVYRVVGLRRRRSVLELLGDRSLSAFVGRQRELDTMLDLFAEAARGRGQMVGIVGDAGIGKSRLLFEFRRTLMAERRPTILEGRCVAYGTTVPYLPILDLLQDSCGITETDSPPETASKLRLALQELGMDPTRDAPYLLRALGLKDGTDVLNKLNPDVIKARTFELLRQMSVRTSRRRPLVLVVEDLHWIDKTSEEVLASLADSLSGASVLLVMTYRPGYRPAWADRSYASQINLRPLSAEDSLGLVRSLVRGEELPHDVIRTVLDKTDGNPFFLEESTRALEQGDSGAVPDTVQEVLMARIDRLADAPRQMLQVASVLGREFPLSLVEATWDGSGEVTGLIAELKRQEFLYERAEVDGSVYIFKHSLTQEVAYDSLLTSRRQVLHAAAGRALETLYADGLDRVYDRLAHHYSRAGGAEKAVNYLSRFARHAARASAHVEAVAAFSQALGLTEHLTPNERIPSFLDIIPRLARSMFFLGRFEEIRELLLRQKALVERLARPQVTGGYYLLLAQAQVFLGDLKREISESAERAIREARACDDKATLGKAHGVLALHCLFLGELARGVEHAREAVSLLEGVADAVGLGHAHVVLGMNLGLLGEWEAALTALERARTIADQTGDPRLQTPAAWATALVYTVTGESAAAIDACQRALELARDPFNTADALAHLAIAYIESGSPGQAVPLLERSLDLISARPDQGWFTYYLGEAYLLSGELEKARALVTQALRITRDTGRLGALGSGLRVLALICLAEGALTDAEAHLGEALEVCRSQNSRWLIGRIQLEMARVAHARGDHRTAQSRLEEARAVFEALRMPRHVERSESLARELSVEIGR